MNGHSIRKEPGRKGICRISLSGRFGDSAALELEDELNSMLGREVFEATINFGGVTGLSRENLGVLFGMVSSFRAIGARLSLCNLPPAAEAEIKLLTGEDYFDLVRG